VARDVQHHAPPGEARRVGDVGSRNGPLLLCGGMRTLIAEGSNWPGFARIRERLHYRHRRYEPVSVDMKLVPSGFKVAFTNWSSLRIPLAVQLEPRPSTTSSEGPSDANSSRVHEDLAARDFETRQNLRSSKPAWAEIGGKAFGSAEAQYKRHENHICQCP